MKKNTNMKKTGVFDPNHPYFENEADRKAFRMSMWRTVHVPAAKFTQ